MGLVLFLKSALSSPAPPPTLGLPEPLPDTLFSDPIDCALQREEYERGIEDGFDVGYSIVEGDRDGEFQYGGYPSDYYSYQNPGFVCYDGSFETYDTGFEAGFYYGIDAYVDDYYDLPMGELLNGEEVYGVAEGLGIYRFWEANSKNGNWIYHFGLGYLYLLERTHFGATDVWLHHPILGEIWWNESHSGYFFQADQERWIFIWTDSDYTSWMFDFEQNVWHRVDDLQLSPESLDI